MFKQRFIIINCLSLVLNQSYAEFWCSDHVLETLIQCLLETPIKADLEVLGLEFEVFYHRLHCAQIVDCTPEPWDLKNDQVEQVKHFVNCMETVATWLEENRKTTQELAFTLKLLNVFESQCRLDLAQNLPDHLKLYYWLLLGEKV